ncbi:ABC transporter ATP-binding protein [Bacillus pseudomycoides]|uniref:ABC transporter ATP-binding protein n=1 Tax=Bacillus pseudomycoides TaxID=64104 RepID=A0A2B5RNP2_9BACI|nr:ABC transporter ATP-binding protein [Bacillus pseudomycoides]PDY48939.1 ABC transporter ATP-binding protein [Bacillus pseudomycoides]PED09942.1 ABC transporter ATP-binding protein [Bacillus pseudomycoides]PED70833.1 ABC transporter ATP-binding protein [Bacillus pseudomycoides]PEI40171.1 ABC transporter ATP-binding protein [Bacillus pseudomycoides]PEJ79617.1 ABC transporter ATP-binding protein [Bacillus pseudomycoides]
MLKVTELGKTIDNQVILDNISFTLQKGSIVGLLGRNGAGKTTLLRTLVGILDPDEGTVTYDDVDVHKHPEIKQKVAYVPDSTNILSGYTVKEIAKFYKAVYTNFNEEYFYQLLERFNLPEKRIRSYSRGMKALLAMILAFCTGVEYIILDEPTNGLDPIVKRQILQFLIEEVAEREITILISTHHLDEVEKIADTVIILKNHTIASITALEDTKSRYAKIQVAYERSLPQKLENLNNIKILNQTGKVYTILIESNVAITLEKFHKEQPLLLEELPMSLEDIFVTTFEEDSHVS